MTNVKSIVKFANTNATAGATINETVDGSTGTVGSPAWSEYKKSCWKMDVLFDVKTFAGTSITFTVKERMSGVGFVETAKTAAITATGRYFLTHEVCESTVETGNVGSFAMLGKGLDKQILSTTSSVSALDVDIYLIFYHE